MIPHPVQSQSGGSDTLLIKETAFNYMEGWYTGNAERMKKALHPDLAKRSIRMTDTVTKNQFVNSITADAMIKLTGAGSGKKLKGANQKIDYLLLDHNDQLAMVRLISLDFIDYLELGKINGELKIVNVLWMNNTR
jgi:hypothetical protein